MTIKEQLAAYAATRPAFSGPIKAEPLAGKASRKNAKARAITKANKAS